MTCIGRGLSDVLVTVLPNDQPINEKARQDEQSYNNSLLILPYSMLSFVKITTDVRQPSTNYVNNGNKHLIVGADVRSEYSNIRYLHLIIGKAQKFVSGDKYDF